MVGGFHLIKMINQWLQETIKTEGYLKYDDLHVDQICGKYKDRHYWIEGAILSLVVANGILATMNTSKLYLRLTIRLRDEDEYLDTNINDINEIYDNLHKSTPPSLYVLTADQIIYLKDNMKINILGLDLDGYDVYYSVHKCGDSDNYRSIMIIASCGKK